MSKQEDYLYSELTKFCPNLYFHRNFRPYFLENQKTGRNLEIDIWNSYFKIGFEYQGMIHFMKVRRFENDPDISRYHDTLKYELIAKDKSRSVIVEVFEKDLRGNVKFNLIKRIENTIEHYKKSEIKGKHSKIKTMQNFIIYLKYYTHLQPKQVKSIYRSAYNINTRKLRNEVIDNAKKISEH